MSETLATYAQHTERAERPVLHREFAASDIEIRGRTVDVRLVPFGEVARVADPPDWRPYDEEWLPGVFDHQLNAANRIHARYGHSQHVVDVVGHGLSLRSVPGDGYHVTATIHETQAGDTALELLRGGALPAVSLEAQPVRSQTTNGVMQRMKANLTGFAFCRVGAFAGAQVLAMREETEVVFDEALLPVGMSPERVERLRALGIHLPDRYQAHPDESDTPAETGTSADGTRQSAHTTNQVEVP